MSLNALGWGSCTAVLIAMYTVTDGLGVRAAGNGLSYIIWLFIFEVIPIGGILLVYRRRAWLSYMRAHYAEVVAGGIASSAAYGLVIFAMSLGAMAVVSSLRETSVIFAAIIGAMVLREPFGRARVRAAILVAAGIGVMRLLG
jgi:drug/metabolite transporter (DMT)-like permease